MKTITDTLNQVLILAHMKRASLALTCPKWSRGSRQSRARHQWLDRHSLKEIMANSAPGGANDYNRKIIAEFQANEGRVGGPWRAPR